MVAIEYDDNKVTYNYVKHVYDPICKLYKLENPLYDNWAIPEYALLSSMDGVIFCLEGDEEKALQKVLNMVESGKNYCEDVSKVIRKELLNVLYNKY